MKTRTPQAKDFGTPLYGPTSKSDEKVAFSMAEDLPLRRKIRTSFHSWVLLGLLSFTLTYLLAPSAATSAELGPHSAVDLDDILVRDLEDYPSVVVQTSDGTLLSNNRTDVVQWDEYSLVVRGQRIFL